MGAPTKSGGNAQRATGTLIASVFSAAIGSSFLFGWAMGVINIPQTVVGLWIRESKCRKNGGTPSEIEGAVTDIWCKKLDPIGQGTMFAENSELNAIWATVSALFCVGGLIGALSTPFFVARFGPKGTMLANNAIGLLGALLVALPYVADSHELLIVGRFIVGLATGVNSGVPSLYFNEISPAHLRGAIGSVHQLAVVVAILTSNVLGLPFVLGNAWGWPYLFGLAAVFCVVQLITLPFCPESPKWLFLVKDDEERARKALVRFRGTEDVGAEMTDIRAEHTALKNEPKVSIVDLWTNKFLRSVTFIAAMLMVCQQFSGINAVMFYSTQIFLSAGLDNMSALYGTCGIGGANIFMTLVSVALVERLGRRALLLMAYSGMLVSAILLVCSMLLYDSGKPPIDSPAGINQFAFFSYFNIVFVISFVMSFAVGAGSIPWFLTGEMFTQGPRAAANSIAVAVNWLCTLLVTLIFPFVQAAIKEYSFLIFAGFLVLFIIYTKTQVVETKGKSMEEIQRDLRRSTNQLARQDTASW